MAASTLFSHAIFSFSYFGKRALAAIFDLLRWQSSVTDSLIRIIDLDASTGWRLDSSWAWNCTVDHVGRIVRLHCRQSSRVKVVTRVVTSGLQIDLLVEHITHRLLGLTYKFKILKMTSRDFLGYLKIRKLDIGEQKFETKNQFWNVQFAIRLFSQSCLKLGNIYELILLGIPKKKLVTFQLDWINCNEQIDHVDNQF